jgi:type IV pilus assembly protein PilQ
MNTNFNFFIAIFLTTILSGCAGLANRQLDKSSVPKSPDDVREIIAKTRQVDPIDTRGLTKNERPAPEEIRSKDLFSVKSHSDPTIFNYPTWKSDKFSADFAIVSIADFFALVGELNGINFYVGQDVSGEVSLQVKDMAWKDIVDIVLATKRLVAEISDDGKSVRINSIEFVAERSDTVKKLLTQRFEEQRVRQGLEQKNTAVIRVFYSKADTVSKMLREMLLGLEARPGAGAAVGAQAQSARAAFTVDVRTNSIVVQASAADIDWIKKTVSHIDKPSKQVMVEAYIVEGRDNFQQELGVRLGIYAAGTNSSGQPRSLSGVLGEGATSQSSMVLGTGTGSSIGTAVSGGNATTAVGGLGFLLATGTGQLKAELLGMEKDGLTKIVSNPRLFIIDNEQASITDGVQIPYPVPGVGPSQITYEFKDAALKLDVKPSIVGDGNIYIEVVVNKDSPNYATNPPAIDKREVRTKLLIRDGGIAMIGGINISTASSTDTQVPILGSIPLIGNLFKSTAQGNERRQLFIFLSPAEI